MYTCKCFMLATYVAVAYSFFLPCRGSVVPLSTTMRYPCHSSHFSDWGKKQKCPLIEISVNAKDFQADEINPVVAQLWRINTPSSTFFWNCFVPLMQLFLTGMASATSNLQFTDMCRWWRPEDTMLKPLDVGWWLTLHVRGWVRRQTGWYLIRQRHLCMASLRLSAHTAKRASQFHK